MVSKHFSQLCLAPELLRILQVDIGRRPATLLARLHALRTLLAAHAGSVHSLTLAVVSSESQQHAVQSVVADCLAHCGAAGALRQLSISRDTPLCGPGQAAMVPWLAGLTALHRLRLGSERQDLHLPDGFSHLTALEDADVDGLTIILPANYLPASLTRLRLNSILRSRVSPPLPSQVCACAWCC